MFNLIKKHLSERKHRRLLEAKLKGYGWAWAHYQLEHWPLEDIEAMVSDSCDDYGPEVDQWERGLLEAVRDIETFIAYRARYGINKRKGDHWSDFHGDPSWARNVPGRHDLANESKWCRDRYYKNPISREVEPNDSWERRLAQATSPAAADDHFYQTHGRHKNMAPDSGLGRCDGHHGTSDSSGGSSDASSV